MADFKLTGLEDLNATLLKMQEDFGSKKTRADLRKAVSVAINPIKDQVNANLQPHIETGKLVKTVRKNTKNAGPKDRRKKFVDDNAFVVGYVSVGLGYTDDDGEFRPVAAALEFGTEKLAATPYLRSALTQAAPKSISLLERELQRVLETYRKGGT